MKYVMSDRKLRKILTSVDKQRVVGIIGVRRPGVHQWPMVEWGIPYDDEEFSCGLLTCEFRGWVERFGDEVPIKNMETGEEAFNNLFRITQAGRAVLDRTQTISNVALIVAIASMGASIASLVVSLHK
jgi:hypothetical protein